MKDHALPSTDLNPLMSTAFLGRKEVGYSTAMCLQVPSCIPRFAPSLDFAADHLCYSSLCVDPRSSVLSLSVDDERKVGLCSISDFEAHTARDKPNLKPVVS